MTKLKC